MLTTLLNPIKNWKTITLAFLILGCTDLLHAQQESLRVFDAYRGNGSAWMQYPLLSNAWYHHLSKQADQYLSQREDKLATLVIPTQILSRQRIYQEKLLQSIGELPFKYPLQTQIVGSIEKDTYTVEKIIFESLPGFYVTSCLFLPKQRQEPAPTVIYVSGHTADGFRAEAYQRVILNLVAQGFVVFAFDPIGQGERYQYFDPETGKPNIGGPTNEHSYAGGQCLITGTSIARYMIHDGIRAVDYLLTRPEVDGSRIAITGRSGGGTQSSYIAAFDERIAVVAPENYITRFRRLWQSIGPQDAEQNFYDAHKLGIDHADLLLAHAPKPCLLLATTRDFFSIQGVRETYKEVKRVYGIMGQADNLELVEDDGPHGSTKKNREALYAFLQKHLQQAGEPRDREVEFLSPKELQLTETGQVVTSLNSKTIFDLNKELWSILSIPPSPQPSPSTLEPQQPIKLQPFPSPGDFQLVYTGSIPREAYRIEKYFLEFSEGRYPLPFYWIQPTNGPSRSLVLYMYSQGKEKGIQAGGEIEQLVKAGHSVLAPDLLNCGELAAGRFGGDSHIQGISYNLVLGSNLVGTSLPILQAEDLVALMAYIQQHHPGTFDHISAIADRETAVSLLHYAASDSLVHSLVLRDMLLSWEELVFTRIYDPRHMYSVIPGALSTYDLPTIMAQFGPRKVTLLHPLDGEGKPVGLSKAREAYAEVIEQYSQLGKEDQFEIIGDDRQIPFSTIIQKLTP